MSGSKLEEVKERLSNIRDIGNSVTVDGSTDDLNRCIDVMMHGIDGLIEYITTQ